MSTSVMKQQQLPSGTYVFSSQPKAIRKYRDRKSEQETNGPSYWNIMFDPRVVRGNTYALNQTLGMNTLEEQKQREQRRKDLMRKRNKQLQQQQQQQNQSRNSQKSPPPVDGRAHVELQTEQYLEELADRVVEADNCCQTDEFLERPPTPLFVPAKIGLDAETQIYDGELFDFDVEVRPVVEVLIGKTMEQALMETMEEEELASIRNQQRIFEEMRNAELVEVQRMEEKERRIREEKERRIRQEQEMLEAEKETADKIAANAFAKGFLQDLIPSVFESLTNNGYFCDPVEREIETEFLPWLMDQVASDVKLTLLSRALVDDVIVNVVNNRAAEFETLSERQEEIIPTQRIDTPPQNPLQSSNDDEEDGEEDSDENQETDDVTNRSINPKEEKELIDTIAENEDEE